MEATDAGLLERWNRQRDGRAFQQLVRRYSGMVYATSLRVLGNSAEAEDIAQECFVKLSDADPHIGSHLGPWLHTVATRLSLNRRKSDLRRQRREEAYAREQTDRIAGEEDEWIALIDAEIAALDPKERIVVVMHFIEGRSQRSIAKALDISRKTVSARISKGLDRIRASLKKHGAAITPAVLIGAMTSEANAAPPTLIASLGKRAIAGNTMQPVAKDTLVTRFMATMTSLRGAAVAIVVVGGLVGLTQLNMPDASESFEPQTVRATSDLQETVVDSSDPSPISSDGAAPVAEVAEDKGDDPTTLAVRCVGVDGAPVLGAVVYVMRHLNVGNRRFGPPAREDRMSLTIGPFETGPEGALEVPVDAFGVHLEGFVYAYAHVPGKFAGGTHSQTPLSNDSTGLTIELDEIARVEGFITVPSGFEARGVTVHVLGFNRDRLPGGNQYSGVVDDRGPGPVWPPVMATKTNASGKFALRGVPRDVVLRLAANGPGLGETQWMAKIDDGKADIVLDMEPEGIIEGALVLESGQPAKGMTVFARGADLRVVRHEIVAALDGRGRFRIDGLAEGTYAVVALTNHPDTPLVANVVHDVHVKAGAVTRDVVLIAEPGCVVSGTIRDAETGEALAGASIAAQQVSGTDDQWIVMSDIPDDGRFSIRLPTGDTEVYIPKIPEGYVRTENSGKIVLSIDAGERARDGVDFALARDANPQDFTAKGTITGTVVDAQSAPLEGVSIAHGWKYHAGVNLRQQQATGVATTDSLGRFNLEVTAPGQHRVIAGGGPYSAAQSDWFGLKGSEVRELPALTVRPLSAVINGIVVDPDGLPLGGASVMIGAMEYIQIDRPKTGLDGRFRIEHLPEGEVAIGVIRPGYVTSELTNYMTGEFVEIVLQPKSERAAVDEP